jgi:hypothetical protein
VLLLNHRCGSQIIPAIVVMIAINMIYAPWRLVARKQLPHNTMCKIENTIKPDYAIPSGGHADTASGRPCMFAVPDRQCSITEKMLTRPVQPP